MWNDRTGKSTKKADQWWPQSGNWEEGPWLLTIEPQVVHENVLKLTVMIVQFCDYIKNNWAYTWKRWNYDSWTLSQWAHQQGYMYYDTTYSNFKTRRTILHIAHTNTYLETRRPGVVFKKYRKLVLTYQNWCQALPSGEHMKNIHLAGEKGKRQSSDSSHLLWGGTGGILGEGTTLSSTVPLKENSSKQHKMSRSHQRWLVSTRTSGCLIPLYFSVCCRDVTVSKTVPF